MTKNPHSAKKSLLFQGLLMEIDIAKPNNLALLTNGAPDLQREKIQKANLTQVATNRFCTFQKAFSSLSPPRRGDIASQ